MKLFIAHASFLNEDDVVMNDNLFYRIILKGDDA